MASFPTDWDIFPEDVFDTYTQNEPLESPMGMTTLIKLDRNGRSTGVFKVILFGGGIVDIPIPVADILHEPPPHIADCVIKLSVRTDRVTIALNSTTSAWRDLLALLRGTSASVTDLNGDPVSADPLIQYLHSLATSTEKCTDGASIRWAIAAAEDNMLQLEIHSLPVQAASLRKPPSRRTIVSRF